MPSNLNTSAWLKTQGYDLSPAMERRLRVPIRFAPVMCTAFTAAFLALGSVEGFIALGVVAAAGTVLPRHPFDYLYGWLINPALRTGVAPATPAPRRLMCGTAAVTMVAIAASLTLAPAVLPWVLGSAFLAVGVSIVTTNWCVVLYLHKQLAAHSRVPGFRTAS